MTQRLTLAMLDQEIARIAVLSGAAQRQAAIKLAIRQAAPLGASPWSLQCLAVEGRELTMRVVRDAHGDLQLSEIVRADAWGRWA